MSVLSCADRIPPECFELNGCCLLERVLSAELLLACRVEIDRLLELDHCGVLKSQSVAYGIRNLLQLWPEVVQLARVAVVSEFIQRILGPKAGVVRGLLFDKPPQRGWTLPWHRDRTVAFDDSYRDGPLPTGFSNRTVKAGVPHAIAPNWLLERMVTLRFSLDPMTSTNGPLVFVPGSHRIAACEPMEGSSQQCDEDLGAIDEGLSTQQIVTQYCDSGDLFIMRPLLAHSSLNTVAGTEVRRRVVHLEICQQVEGVPWFEYCEI